MELVRVQCDHALGITAAFITEVDGIPWRPWR